MTFKSTALFTSIIWVTLLLFVDALYAAESYPNEPIGFRGIAWGTPLFENKDEMVYVKSNVGVDSYSRKNSKMSIGKARLSELYYGYLKNRLLVVYIKTSNKKDHALLRKELEKQFGTGPWNGKIGTVVIALRSNASIYSTQLMREGFEQIEVEVKKLGKLLRKKYPESKSGSDF